MFRWHCSSTTQAGKQRAALVLDFVEVDLEEPCEHALLALVHRQRDLVAAALDFLVGREEDPLLLQPVEEVADLTGSPCSPPPACRIPVF
jgi:hypothetical protein